MSLNLTFAASVSQYFGDIFSFGFKSPTIR